MCTRFLKTVKSISIIFSNTIASGHSSWRFIFNFWHHHFRFWFMADFVIFTIFKGQKSRIFNVPYLGTKKVVKFIDDAIHHLRVVGLGCIFIGIASNHIKIWRKIIICNEIVHVSSYNYYDYYDQEWLCLSISSSLTVMNFANKI